MPSSTSSSKRHLPPLPWVRILGAALAVFSALVLFMEIRLAQLGYRPTLEDSPSGWASERARASRLGGRALILIGASRIQLDMDLEALRRETGLEPVQLAIGGGSFVPVLAGLAADTAIRGTVLVDYGNGSVIEPGGDSANVQQYYEKYWDSSAESSPSTRSETALTQALHSRLRSYADGASPLTSLVRRVARNHGTSQYVVRLPDRSWMADYRRVEMPAFYYQRVIRELGVDLDPESAGVTAALKEKIAGLQPADNQVFFRQTEIIRGHVAAIEARGGRVIFVAFPTSGMVREIDDRRYPRELFWDRFVERVGAPALRSADVPALGKFSCPDGSHLDFRDRPDFTRALVRALGLSRHAGKGG